MKKIQKILLIILILIFLSIGFMVRGKSEGILFDVSVIEFIQGNENPILFKLMKGISFIGSGYFLFPIILIVSIYILIKKEYYILKLLLGSTLGCYSLNFLLKQLFQRTRPLDFFLVEQSGLSYPSGHSMVTMSLYLTIAYLITKNQDDIKKRRYIYLLAFLMILLMGISRIYLGVHWPTDVLGGYIMGYVFYNINLKIMKE